MKKIALTVAVALMAASLFAQSTAPAAPAPGPMMGPGGITWKLGTVVTTEYKKLTGQLLLGQRLAPVFKADGVEYILQAPRNASVLLNLKDGDTLTIEGTATTVKGTDTVQPEFHAFKVTIAGKETDLTANMGPGGKGDRRGGMMGGQGMGGQGMGGQGMGGQGVGGKGPRF